jgi:hypothetical protein
MRYTECGLVKTPDPKRRSLAARSMLAGGFAWHFRELSP